MAEAIQLVQSLLRLLCDFTPLGANIQADGGLLADLDGDCDVDLDDFAMMQAEFTGAVSP